MDRIVVIGTSGSGKTTLARQLGEHLGYPVIELDALHWMPGWEMRPDDEFQDLTSAAISGEQWVTDGNYSKLGGIVLMKAQLVVWLDYPRHIIMGRVIRRTLRRMVTREELWNGNREPLSNLFSLDPHRNIMVWAWTTHGGRRVRYQEMMDDPKWSHIDFVRLRHPREATRFLESLDSPQQ